MKPRKVELDVSFLESCQRFNVFPKFICFQLSNVNKYDVNAIRKHLLKSAIRKRCKEKRRLQNEKDKLEGVVKQVSNGIDVFTLNKAQVKYINCEVHLTVKNHQKKLRKLTKNCILPFLSKETVTNISSHKLTFDGALKFGLTHSIVPFKLGKTDISPCFETIFQSMNSNLVDKRDESKLRADLSHLAQSYVNSFRPSQHDIKIHKNIKPASQKIKISFFSNRIKVLE